MKVTTVGVDLAKAVFAVHGVDGRGLVKTRRLRYYVVDIALFQRGGRAIREVGA